MDPAKISTSTIPIFDGSNYQAWYNSLRGIFRLSGVWDIVEANNGVPTLRPTSGADEQSAWDEKNNKALGYMSVYMNPSLQHLIGDESVAATVWKNIKDKYGKPGGVGAFVYFQQLFRTTLNDSKPLRPQITELEAARQRTTNAGIKVDDMFMALLILTSLPESYSNISGTILATIPDISAITPNDVIPKIIEEESLRNAASNNSEMNRVIHAKPQKCNKCGKTNHTTENHWPDGKPPAKGNGKKKKKKKKDSNATATTTDTATTS